MNNKPAFPTETFDIAGMTLRDYFAAKAMQSYMADIGIPWTDDNFERAASAAYCLADKMMEARK